MRCIEILNLVRYVAENDLINRNMRCIEMTPLCYSCPGYGINRNMRCIEIIFNLAAACSTCD